MPVDIDMLYHGCQSWHGAWKMLALARAASWNLERRPGGLSDDLKSRPGATTWSHDLDGLEPGAWGLGPGAWGLDR